MTLDYCIYSLTAQLYDTMVSEDSKKDPILKYGYLDNLKNNNNLTYSFCGKEGKGGIFRHKEYLVSGYRNIKKYPKSPRAC